MDRVYSICSLGRESITLGMQGDNKARRLLFDVSHWLSEHPGAVVTGYAIPPEGEGYPIALEMDGEMAIWTIRDSDTAYAGRGEVQLVLLGADGEKLHSSNACTQILRSAAAEAGGEAPEPIRAWMDKIETAAAGSLRFDIDQKLTEAQKARARNNIGAGTGSGENPGSGGGFYYKIGHGLKITNDETLEVDTADKVQEDNTLPVTSAAVYTEVGNINALLATI